MRQLEQLAISQQLQIEQYKSKKKSRAFPSQPKRQNSQKSSPKASPIVSTDEQYNQNLTSGSENEGDDEGGMVNTKPQKKKSTAKSSGGSFIKGQTLKPIDERYVIGKAAPLPFNDLSNDSFLVKPRTADPVV